MTKAQHLDNLARSDISRADGEWLLSELQTARALLRELVDSRPDAHGAILDYLDGEWVEDRSV